MTPQPGPGRQHQKVSALTVNQQLGLTCAVLAMLCLALWHVTVALTTTVPWSGIGITMKGLLQLDPIGLPEPYAPASTIWTVAVFVALLAATLTAAYWVKGRTARRRARRTGKVGLASRDQTRVSAGEQRAREKAAYGRRGSVADGTLNTATCPLNEVGLLLGTTHDHGEPVILTLEDQVAILGPTGAGKTLYIMIGAALDAPGPLVATSTRPEILDAIKQARERRGRVWVFDPLNVAHYPHPMVWNPVAGAEISQNASALGEAFAAGFEVESGNAQFFQAAAGQVVARFLHAAALANRDMVTVLSWAMDLARSNEAQTILEAHPQAEILWAETLRVASEGADETTSSTRMTLGQKVDPILSRLVLRQMIPTHGVPVFDPKAFVRSNDTLILITDDQAQTNVAPLTTMLLSAVVDAAKAAAAMSMTGRLDPPMRIIGDEIANVAPLPKLPGLLSDSRGTGVQWMLAFQSLAQIFARWNEDQGRQILANLNCSMVLGGLQDEKALERFSELVGDVDLTEVSTSLDANRLGNGQTISRSEKTALRPGEIRGLVDGQALVIYRNTPAMLVNLIRWTDRADGKATAASIEQTRAERIGSRTPVVAAPIYPVTP